MPQFLNKYECPGNLEYRKQHAPAQWDDEWSCACNDKCPECNAEIEPYESEEIDDGRVHTGTAFDLEEIDAAEIAMILAALRYFQTQFKTPEMRKAVMPEHFEDNEPLTSEQIDALCEYINLEA